VRSAGQPPGLARRGQTAHAFVRIRLLAVVVAPILVIGCASDDSGERSPSSGSIVATDAEGSAPTSQILEDEDIRHTNPGSVPRAFLNFWAALQYQAWSSAVSYYEPGLVDTIGKVRLIEALKAASPLFARTKPTLSRPFRQGDQFVVPFRVVDLSGTPVATSTVWRRVGDRWRIHYHPQLDGFLRSYVQTMVQTRLDPGAREPAKQAVRAGEAANRIQTEYLARSARARDGNPR
jgi:hypothetical protein